MNKGQYQLILGIIVLTSIAVSIGIIYYYSFKPKIETNQTTTTTREIVEEPSCCCELPCDSLESPELMNCSLLAIDTCPAERPFTCSIAMCTIKTTTSTTTQHTTTTTTGGGGDGDGGGNGQTTTTIPTTATTTTIHYSCDPNTKTCEVYPPNGKSIQDAINEAQIGWAIHLNSGTYDLKDVQAGSNYGLRIGKNITIKGSGIDNTILQLANFSVKNIIFIRDMGSGTSLEDFSINGSKQDCEKNAKPCENATAVGIGVSNVTVKNLYIYNSFHGILAWGNSSNALKNILVSSVKLRDLWRNRTEFYDFPAAGYAIQFNYVNESKMEKIDLDSDKQIFSAGDALGIYNSFNITIENSVIKKSSTAGVYIAVGTTVSQFITIRNNVFDANWNSGIDINRGRFINVSNNTISNSKYGGIGIHSTTDSFFVGNRIFNIHFAPNKHLSIEPSEEDSICGNNDYWKASYAAIPIWSMACFDGDPKYPGYFTSQRNVIKGNTLENVNRGIRISWENTTDNRIEDNLIINYSIYCILDLDSNTLSNNTCR